MKMPDWKAIDLGQKPNKRERLIFGLALAVFFIGFVKSCWMPSRRAVSEVKNQIRVMEEEAMPPPSPRLRQTGVAPRSTQHAGSLKEMEAALERLSQPQVLKGVLLLKSRFSEEERQGGWIRRRAELELLGTFQAVGRYISDLESFTSPFWIETFSMKTSDGKVTAGVTGGFYARE